MPTITGTSRDEAIFGGLGDDLIRGLGGDDFLVGWQYGGSPTPGDGRDTLIGGAGRDHLYGGGETDLLDGGDDADKLDGDAGKDRLEGGSGDDSLLGGRGNDRLIAGDGADLLSGGQGRDQFTYFANTESYLGAVDVIADLTQGDDVIRFLGPLGQQLWTFIGSNSFSGASGNEIRYEVDGEITRVEADMNMDLYPDMIIILTGRIFMTEDDFLIG